MSNDNKFPNFCEGYCLDDIPSIGTYRIYDHTGAFVSDSMLCQECFDILENSGWECSDLVEA